MEVGEKVVFPSSPCACFGQAVQASHSCHWCDQRPQDGVKDAQCRAGLEPSCTLLGLQGGNWGIRRSAAL